MTQLAVYLQISLLALLNSVVKKVEAFGLFP